MKTYIVGGVEEYVMRSFMHPGYLTLAWPVGMSAWQLKHALELCEFQLGHCIRDAEREEAGPIEYASWFPDKREPQAADIEFASWRT